MIKNFSAWALGINGRQSELIELGLTYGFNGLDIDLDEMYRRNQRSESGDASKYLDAAKKQFDLNIGGFNIGIHLDGDEDAFVAEVEELTPLAEFAKELNVSRAYIALPAATDRLPFNEYFEAQSTRLQQIAEVLAGSSIRLGVRFRAGKELGEGKQFPFVRTTEEYLSFVKGIGGNVGFLIDTWDWVVGGGTMDQLIELAADQIVAVQISSVAEDVDLATAESNQRVVPESSGAFDHTQLITHLASIGFDGPVSPGASNQSYKGKTRENIVGWAQEAIDGIFTSAGLEVAPLPKDTIEDIPYEPAPVI